MEKRCCGCMRMKTQSPLCEHCGYNENIDNLSHQLSIDTVLNGRYRVGKVLGQGGFGITYIGWDEKRNHPVAIKEYYPNGVANRDITRSPAIRCKEERDKAFFQNNRELFLNEARALARFGNVPQIVHVQNVFEMNNTVYIAMEHLRGVDLRRHIRMHGLLNPEQTFQILRPVIRALGRVHGAGLVHRDISPDNIMILPDGSAKLLDFGAAGKISSEADQDEPKAAEAILKHGFAPPEQYKRDGNLGPWTDVYALCATIHYCLTGKIPASVAKRREGAVLAWEKVPGLTPEQKAALEKGMELEIEDRFPNVESLYEALFGQLPEEIPESKAEPVKKAPEESTDAQAQKPVQPTAPVKEKKTRKPLSKKVILGIAAAVLCIAAAAAVVKVMSIPRGWKTEGEVRCYYENGTRLTGLQQIDGISYYFSETGELCTGWQEIGGEMYYFAGDGAMVCGTVTIDGMEHTFQTDGKFVSRSRTLTAEDLRTRLSEDKASYTGTNGKTLKSEYQILSSPVTGCTQLTVELQLTQYKHGNVDEWCFYYRDLNGQWHQTEAVFALENDRAVRTYTFPEPISFDACACFCLSLGSLWNFETSCTLTGAEIMEHEI